MRRLRNRQEHRRSLALRRPAPEASGRQQLHARFPATIQMAQMECVRIKRVTDSKTFKKNEVSHLRFLANARANSLGQRNRADASCPDNQRSVDRLDLLCLLVHHLHAGVRHLYIHTRARACKTGKEVSERQKIARRLLDCISITSFTR